MKINPSGKLQHMISPDLFTSGVKQVFNAKTGKWIGKIDTRGTLFEKPEEENIIPIEEPIPQDPNQLQLFQ